ncbi:MAG TPA: hypothetical protein PLK73_01935 [Candidatus Omnitrophota bacterium]|nr:hypothetical protein [Candidatus Omnitrophota bacterium]HQB12155.1 hypothetical protein [Candidatus Omnitrophota bacterium]
MRVPWPWVIAIFGFLLSIRGEQKRGFSLVAIWRETLDLFLTQILAVTLYHSFLRWSTATSVIEEFGFLILWTLIYLIAKYQKKPDLFLITAVLITHAVVQVCEGWLIQSSLLLVIASGLFIFQAAVKGLRRAILFSGIPPAMKGWPVLCLIAFCISVVMSGILDILF